jgi:acyl-CoA synthetase (AMP-forming)/AMP-acid ligase II
MRSAHEIFEDAMYQVYGQTETLPVAMTGTRPQFAKDVPTRTTSWRHRTARCERLPQARPSRRHDDPKRGETSCVVICVKPEAAVTEKELVEFCFVHLGNCKRPGKVCCVTIPA